MSLFDLFKKKEFKPETFSGTEEFLHVSTLDDTLEKFEKERPVRGHGESVLGDALYMSDKTDRKWFAPGTDVGSFMTAESGAPEGVYKIKTKFDNALVVTPQNMTDIENNLLQNIEVTKGTYGGSDELRQRLQDLGYDGLVIRGFDELPESYYNREFGTRESPLINLTQDQVIAFDPAESVQSIKEVSPRDYHKALITKAEGKAIERKARSSSDEIVFGKPGDPDIYYPEDLENLPEEEVKQLKPRRNPYNINYEKRNQLRESVTGRVKTNPSARMIGPNVGKALGLAGLGLALTDAKKVYAEGMEQDMGPVISSLAAGGKFAYDTIAPAFTMIFDSPEVGQGSDVVPEGQMFIDPYVTGESMPQYTSLEPDSDLFKGSL
jgi:hypothetical protein